MPDWNDRTGTTDQLPDDLGKQMDPGLWHDCTANQRALVISAWQHDSVIFERKLQTVMQAENPTARLVWQSKRILSGPSRSAVTTRPRRAHDDLSCEWCADTGFVILRVDAGSEALAGDCAPCAYCALGRTKMATHGLVHYTDEQVDRVVNPGPVSFAAHTASEAGKADAYAQRLLRNPVILKTVNDAIGDG